MKLSAKFVLSASALTSSVSALYNSAPAPSPFPAPAPEWHPAPERPIPAPDYAGTYYSGFEPAADSTTNKVKTTTTTATTTTTEFSFCQIYPGYHRCQEYTIRVDAFSLAECASRLDGTTTIFAYSNGKKRCETYTADQCSGDVTQETQDWMIYGSCDDIRTTGTITTTDINHGNPTELTTTAKQTRVTTTSTSATTRLCTTAASCAEIEPSCPTTDACTCHNGRCLKTTTTGPTTTSIASGSSSTTPKVDIVSTLPTTTVTTTTSLASTSVTEDQAADGAYCQFHQPYRKCGSKQSISPASSTDQCASLADGYPYFAYSEDKGKCEVYTEDDCLTTNPAASDWTVYKFGECIATTAAPGQGSCKNKCDSDEDLGSSAPYCHCDGMCSTYHDCCYDYIAECVNNDSDNSGGSDNGGGSDMVCASTCYGLSCDEWETDTEMSCADVEDYGCSCGGCECTKGDVTTKPTTTTPEPGSCQKQCSDEKWAGDDLCDDANNNCGCGWDGGDCCGPFSDDSYCTDCQCKDPDSKYFGTICDAECGDRSSQGDGYCDDQNNICGCDWDGGDCCLTGKLLLTNYCKTCTCLDPTSDEFGVKGGSGSVKS